MKKVAADNTRKRIGTFGKRGALVRVDEVLERGVKKYEVICGSKANRTQKSYPGTPAGKKEAEAYAEGYQLEMAKPKTVAAPPALTTREMWLGYQEATFPALKVRSKQLYAENWRRWEQYFGRERLAESMTLADANGFRAELERVGLATKTIQSAIEQARAVYNWAERSEVIGRNRWHQFRFKVAKDRRTKPRAEYRQHEFLSIWRQFDPTDSDQWRPHVAIGLLGLYGMRQTATLRLQWSDVRADHIVFRAENDKQGEEHLMPMLPLTRELLAVAKAWRERNAYTGPWLFYPGQKTSKSDTYTIQSLWSALYKAEERAGIPSIKYRAGHGFRRGLVGDLLEAGNDMDLALKSIGDRDPRMAKHYAIKRDERIERALAAREASFAGATKVGPTPENDAADHPVTDDRQPATSDTSTT